MLVHILMGMPTLEDGWRTRRIWWFHYQVPLKDDPVHTKMVIPLAALLPQIFGTLIVIYFLLSKGGKIAA